MRVWIDTELCMGAGTCEQIAPDVFRARPDGLWAVAESRERFELETIFDGGSGPGHGPAGAVGVARVPVESESLVVEAADECPAECIYVLP